MNEEVVLTHHQINLPLQPKLIMTMVKLCTLLAFVLVARSDAKAFKWGKDIGNGKEEHEVDFSVMNSGKLVPNEVTVEYGGKIIILGRE